VIDCLKHQGIQVWVDTQEIQGGDAWRAAIVRAITDCEAFLVILSPQCVASKNVVKELSLASEKNRHIIPIIGEPCDIPDGMQYQLAELQRIDFCELGFDAALQRLVNTLRRGASASAVGSSASGSWQSSSPPSPLPATPAPAASDSKPFSATTFPFPQPRPQPAVPNIEQLGAALCGRWRVQIIAPGVGPIGELIVDLFPNLAFNGQLMMAVGISSAVSGMWQVTAPGQLVLPRGQGAAVDQGLDVVQMAVGMLSRSLDAGVRRAETAAAHGLERQRARHSQAGDGRLDRVGIDPGIDHGSQRHVARDAAEAVEVSDAHACHPYHGGD